MPRNKASRLRLAQPEPEPEPEPEPQARDWSDESRQSRDSGSGSDGGSVESLESTVPYEAQLRAIFQRADRNGDGGLKRAELILRLRKDEDLAELLDLPVEAGYAQRKALDALFASMDASGDGDIDQEEFVRYFADKAAREAAEKAAAMAVAAAAAEEESLSIDDRIARIYEVYNPRKIEQIDALLAEWEGEEEVLYTNIKEKYSVPEDFFAPETPGSAPGNETASSHGSAADSDKENKESGEQDKSKRRQKEEEEIAARYQWMVDLQQEQERGSEEEEEHDTGEEESSSKHNEEASDRDQASSGAAASDDGDESIDECSEDDEKEIDDDNSVQNATEDEETGTGTGSDYGTASKTGSRGSERSVEHDGDLGVPWDEENLYEIQRRSELIKQAKVFRVKISRDSTGRGTYSSIYAPENQEPSRGKEYRDPEVLRKQKQVDAIAQIGETKRRKSSGRHAKPSDPELAAIAARVRAQIKGSSGSGSDSNRSSGSTDDNRPERPWQKKLRERWDRPMDDFGMYSVDTEMVQALKQRKKLREEAEAAKSGSLLVPQYHYGSEGDDDGGDGLRTDISENPNATDATGADDTEYYSENGEEQEMFRVVRRGNRGRMKMSRVTAVKKKKKRTAALTPRAVRNQLMLDKLSDVQRKDAEEAAAVERNADKDENAQAADEFNDDHLPRAKANRNINVKHADGSSSWIRKGQLIVITESERGQPCKGYLEGNPQDVGVFLKSKIIIRTEEQVSMFADVSEATVEEEQEKIDNAEGQQDEQSEKEQNLAATGLTATSHASTERSGLIGSIQGQSRPSSIASSQRKSRLISTDVEEVASVQEIESPIGSCRFCGFLGPVSEHPTSEFPDCPHDPVIKANDASSPRPLTANSAALSEKSDQMGSDWSAEMWSALPVGDSFDLRKEPAPSNRDLMERVLIPNDEEQAYGASRPTTPEIWAEGASGQKSHTQKEPWAKLLRAAGMKPEPRPSTDAVLVPVVAAGPHQEVTGSSTAGPQKEDDVRAVEKRVEQLNQDKDTLFMNALAGVEAVISRATTPQDQVVAEAEENAVDAAQTKAMVQAEEDGERSRAEPTAEEQEAAAATKIAAAHRGRMARTRVLELRQEKKKEDERTALFKKLRQDAESAKLVATDPAAAAALADATDSAAASTAAAQEQEEKAAAEVTNQAEAEDAAIEKAELSDVFVTLDPLPRQIASTVADSFLNAKSGSVLPLNMSGIAGHTPALTRPKKGLEAARRLPRDPQLWNTEQVCEWLAGLGLEEYSNNFQEQSISGDILLELSASDLQDDRGLRIARLGHRKLLTKAISQLQYRSESDLTLAL